MQTHLSETHTAAGACVVLQVYLAGNGSTLALRSAMTLMLPHAGSSGGTGVALAARFAAGGSCTGAVPSSAGLSAGMHTYTGAFHAIL